MMAPSRHPFQPSQRKVSVLVFHFFILLGRPLIPYVTAIPTLSFKTTDDIGTRKTFDTVNDPFKPLTSLVKPHTTLHRILNEDNDDSSASIVLVDSDGEEYEPYAMAWRYLGMYMDCDVQDSNAYYGWTDNSKGGDDDSWDDDMDIEDMANWYRRRRHLSGSQDSGDDCTRKVLWAAYVDPRYKGGSIGEYQFFNFSSGDYSREFCKTRRCVRMDCHEPNTHFKLVGVYKEADGFVDWAEQLFKHQGYCLWSENDYEWMESYREFWPTYCRQLYYSGYNGETLYMDLRPQAEGDITIGIFEDELCVTNSSYTFADYIQMYYNYYGYYDKGYEVSQTWQYAINTWNSYMDVYKVCQPCRAYNLNVNFWSDGDDDDSKSGSGSGDGRRFLDENDGEGDAEQWGYDCYDDAGYTNCNQCYKFEAKTDMEVATAKDLERASKQGTILEIRVNGTTYGHGGFRGPLKITTPEVWMKIFAASASLAVAMSFLYLYYATPYRHSATRWLGTALYWVKDKWSNWRQKRKHAGDNYHLEDGVPQKPERYVPPSESNKDQSGQDSALDESIDTFATAPMDKDDDGSRYADSLQTMTTATEEPSPDRSSSSGQRLPPVDMLDDTHSSSTGASSGVPFSVDSMKQSFETILDVSRNVRDSLSNDIGRSADVLLALGTSLESAHGSLGGAPVSCGDTDQETAPTATEVTFPDPGEDRAPINEDDQHNIDRIMDAIDKQFDVTYALAQDILDSLDELPNEVHEEVKDAVEKEPSTPGTELKATLCAIVDVEIVDATSYEAKDEQVCGQEATSEGEKETTAKPDESCSHETEVSDDNGVSRGIAGVLDHVDGTNETPASTHIDSNMEQLQDENGEAVHTPVEVDSKNVEHSKPNDGNDTPLAFSGDDVNRGDSVEMDIQNESAVEPSDEKPSSLEGDTDDNQETQADSMETGNQLELESEPESKDLNEASLESDGGINPDHEERVDSTMEIESQKESESESETKDEQESSSADDDSNPAPPPESQVETMELPSDSQSDTDSSVNNVINDESTPGACTGENVDVASENETMDKTKEPARVNRNDPDPPEQEEATNIANDCQSDPDSKQMIGKESSIEGDDVGDPAPQSTSKEGNLSQEEAEVGVEVEHGQDLGDSAPPVVEESPSNEGNLTLGAEEEDDEGVEVQHGLDGAVIVQKDDDSAYESAVAEEISSVGSSESK